MSLQVRAIASSIAALQVPGLVIYDLDEIPQTLEARHLPALYPEPSGFITDVTVKRDSFGTGLFGKKTIYYTLTYTLAYAKVGEGRGLFDKYPDMVSMAAAIMDKLVISDGSITGAVLMDVKDVPGFGAVIDPAGALFHGCQFQVQVQEFIN